MLLLKSGLEVQKRNRKSQNNVKNVAFTCFNIWISKLERAAGETFQMEVNVAGFSVLEEERSPPPSLKAPINSDVGLRGFNFCQT